MNYPFVSVIMPCGNEVDFIRKSVGSILDTEYPKDRLEIIIAFDEQSNDGTGKILEEIASKNPIVKILINPHRVVPFAMNKGIRQAKGEIIVRVDAHSEYPPEYISKCVEWLGKTDAWCVGGPFYTTASIDTLMAKIIAAVLSSSFGVANSTFRTKKEAGYVETVPYGAFRKEVFDKIGFYDERLVRHQDYELCRRIAKYGGKIFMTPEIKNIYYPRNTLKKLLHKARYYGLWDAFSHKLCPYTFAWRHFIPGIFFLGLFICIAFIILGVIKSKILLLLGLAPILIYLFLAFISSVNICRERKFNYMSSFLIIGTFFLYHFNFGYGIFKGWMLIFSGGWKKFIPNLKI